MDEPLTGIAKEWAKITAFIDSPEAPARKTFEEFMQEKHAEDYSGTDDDMPDAYEVWIGSLDVAEVMQYAEEYGKSL